MPLAAEQTHRPEPVDIDGRLGTGRADSCAVDVDPAGVEAATPRVSAGRHRLLFEFAVLNLAAFALLAAAYLQDWVDTVLAADGTGLTIAIFGVFLGGLVLCAGKLASISRELNCVRSFEPR